MRLNKKLWMAMITLCVMAATTVFVGCKDDDEQIKVSGVKICPTSQMVTAGNSIAFTADVLPDNADDKSVTWTSANASIATVDNGAVEGVAAGETIINCKSNDGSNITATSSVIVNPAVNENDYATLVPGFYFGNMMMGNDVVQENGLITTTYVSNNKVKLSVDAEFTVAQMGNVQVPVKTDCEFELSKNDNNYTGTGTTTVTMMGKTLPVSIDASFDGAENAKITISVNAGPVMGDIVVNFDGTSQYKIDCK